MSVHAKVGDEKPCELDSWWRLYLVRLYSVKMDAAVRVKESLSSSRT